jgi:thiol-disulfide isomerase/thioredoxin
MRFITFFILLIIAIKCNAQHIQVIKFNELKQRVYNNSDTVYVVIFFASWCKPCIKEIPEFLSFTKEVKNSKIKLVFVSLDFKNNQENLLVIINEFNLKNVYLLDEINANNWIDKIDQNWTGSIPATLIIKKGKHKKFIADSISHETLFNLTK